MRLIQKFAAVWFTINFVWQSCACVYAQDSLPIKLMPPMAEPSAASNTSASNSADNLIEPTSSYILGPGDQLQVMDSSLLSIGQNAETAPLPVAPDGTISIYPVGLIKAAGKTVEQLNVEVREKAKQFMHNPDITISLAKPRQIEVYVLGDVVNPGLYSMPTVEGSGGANGSAASAGAAAVARRMQVVESQTSVQQGSGSQTSTTIIPNQDPYAGKNSSMQSGHVSMTALTAVQLAGGAKPSADVRHVTVKHARDNKEYCVDLVELLVNGKAEQDIVLRHGDRVIVRRGGEAFDADLLGTAAYQERTVRIIGQVKLPGIYELHPQDDVLSMLARAGGFTQYAHTGKVLLSRKGRNGATRTYHIALHKALYDADSVGRAPVQPGDVIFVKESIVKRAGPRTAVIIGTLIGAIAVVYLSAKLNNTNNNSSSSSSTAPSSTATPTSTAVVP